MSNFTDENDADTVLTFSFSNVAIEIVDEISCYPLTQQAPSDDESSPPPPFFDAFYNDGGYQSIVTMIKFDLLQFDTIWNNLRDYIITIYNVGCGRCSKGTTKDAFLTCMDSYEDD